MKKFLAIFFALMLPMNALAEKGTREDPIWPKDSVNSAVVEVTSFDVNTFEEIRADITVQLIGSLDVVATYDKIQESSVEEIRGPLFFCFQFLLTASGLERGEKISIAAVDFFKAYNLKMIECPILTTLENVELLDDTSAYIYVGFRTLGSFPNLIVFNDTVWFEADISTKADY